MMAFDSERYGRALTATLGESGRRESPAEGAETLADLDWKDLVCGYLGLLDSPGGSSAEYEAALHALAEAAGYRRPQREPDLDKPIARKADGSSARRGGVAA
jgi:hypothetical protein